jgi:phytoene dehydrogenase-like protein
VSEYLTPTDFEQLTWNTGGSFGGFQTTPSQIHSPVPHKTLIGNLFVAGQWTGVGAGYINTMLGGLDVSSLWQKRML